MEAIKLRQEYLALKGDRQYSDLESAWDDIERYVRPFSGSFFQSFNTEGENRWRRGEIYDSTAIISADSLAATIQGLLVNPADKWFESKFRLEKLNREDEAKEWLELSDMAVYQALTQSNFDIKGAEFFLDLVTYGTGVVTEEANNELEWDGLDFSTVPIRDVYYELDVNGNLIKLFRRFQWTPLQIITRFGEEHTPESIKVRAEKGTDFEKQECFFAVYPRKDKKDDGEVRPVLERPWGYKYVVLASGEELGEEGGYYEMPAFLAHWKSTSTSKWGKSPAMEVLGDIKNLNIWTEMHRESAAKAVDPTTYSTDRGLLSDLDLQPGGHTIVSKMDALAVLESKANFPASEREMERMINNIQQAFMQDRLALKESPAMTATEVNMRREFMMRSITQPLAILQRNFLDPLIRRTYRILYRAGQLPQVPDIVQDSGSEADIYYTGPLPRTQKTQVVQSEMAFLGFVNELRQVDPDAADIVDRDKMLRNIALNMGVPSLDLNSQEQINDVRQQRQAQLAQQQKLAQLQQAGDAMKSLGEGGQAMEGQEDVAEAIQ